MRSFLELPDYWVWMLNPVSGALYRREASPGYVRWAWGSREMERGFADPEDPALSISWANGKWSLPTSPTVKGFWVNDTHKGLYLSLLQDNYYKAMWWNHE